MRGYDEALQFLHSLDRFGSRLGLERMRRLMGRLGHPQAGLPMVHVGGTNGKGSVVAILDSILRAAGYRVGRYISPYLEGFRERIVIAGDLITEAALAEHVKRLRTHCVEMGAQHPTEFEVVTALGFMEFQRARVDIALIEVGLGGRWDATNIIHPCLAIVTNIGHDHLERLGPDLTAVAWEKAGIIKPLVPVLCGEKSTMIQRVAVAKRAPLFRFGADFVVCPGHMDWDGQYFTMHGLDGHYRNLHLPLLGRHQLVNASLAIGAAEILRRQGWDIPAGAIRAGLKCVSWPGRLELLSRQPLVVLDGAHNREGAVALAAALKELGARDMTLVAGILADKEYGAMLPPLLPFVRRVIVTKPANARALSTQMLADAVRTLHPQLAVESCPDLAAALSRGLESSTGGGLLVSGSLYLVGPARGILTKMLS